MKKTARVIYLIVGTIMPIFIGSLHTFVHFTDLTTPEVKEHLNSSLIILGNSEMYWNTWGLMSFMMGFAFIIIGLLNTTIFKMMKKEDYPPIFALLVMAIYLVGVIYAGNEFNALPQFYGAIVGLTLTIVSIFLTIKGDKN